MRKYLDGSCVSIFSNLRQRDQVWHSKSGFKLHYNTAFKGRHAFTCPGKQSYTFFDIFFLRENNGVCSPDITFEQPWQKKEKYMYVEGKETAHKKILYREMVESAWYSSFS